jgi:hypothetical protein
MSADTVAGIVGGILSVLTCVGLGTKWFLEWYTGYKERNHERSHKWDLEKQEAEHKRSTERSNEVKALENTVISRWKAIAGTLEKQNQQLMADGTKKQELLDLIARENRHCREAFAAAGMWMRYANERLKVLDPEWRMDPPNVELEEFDAEFHTRNSAQDIAVLRAMPSGGGIGPNTP